jgi:hypothetical protein
MMRRYYVQALDEDSGAPCLDEIVEAGTPRDALYQAHRRACFRAGHLRVRVTQIAEQSVDAAGAVARQLMEEIAG